MNAHDLLRLAGPDAGNVGCFFQAARVIFENLTKQCSLLGGLVGRCRQHVRLTAQRLADRFDPVGCFIHRIGKARHSLTNLTCCFVKIGAAPQIGHQQPQESRWRKNTGAECPEFMRQEGTERLPADIRRDLPGTPDQPQNRQDQGGTGRTAQKRRKNTPEKICHSAAFLVKYSQGRY